MVPQAFHSEKVLMKRSWAEADSFCQELGANLASFLRYEEQAFVKGLLQNMFDGFVPPNHKRHSSDLHYRADPSLAGPS